MEIQTILKDGLAALGLSTDCAEKLERYGTALVEKNKVMNLTAITDPAGVAQKHMLDCAAVLGAAELDKKRVIDVGTGAGFPGLVLKICDGSIDLTLLDSLQKRTGWRKFRPSWTPPPAPSMAGRRNSAGSLSTGSSSTWPPPGPWPTCECCASSACPSSR